MKNSLSQVNPERWPLKQSKESGPSPNYKKVDVLNTAISTIALPALLYAIKVWHPPDVKYQQLPEKV